VTNSTRERDLRNTKNYIRARYENKHTELEKKYEYTSFSLICIRVKIMMGKVKKRKIVTHQ
jgi:hypothetical protein